MVPAHFNLYKCELCRMPPLEQIFWRVGSTVVHSGGVNSLLKHLESVGFYGTLQLPDLPLAFFPVSSLDPFS